jgi:hypothetical protein
LAKNQYPEMLIFGQKLSKFVSLPRKFDNPYCHFDREDLDSVLSAAQFLKIRGLIRHDSEDEEDLVETNSVNEPRWDTFFLDFSCFQKILSWSPDPVTSSESPNLEFSRKITITNK